MKTDVLSCSQTYKNLPAMLNVTPHTWIQARNSVLTCAIDALSHESVKPVHKAVTADQLYSIVQPSFVSPLRFATNLLVYSVTRSKLALNIHGKIHPAGGNTTVKTWLNDLTMEVPQVPSGDILTAIDNDQVLIRKWTVCKDNRGQISVPRPGSHLRQNWDKFVLITKKMSDSCQQLTTPSATYLSLRGQKLVHRDKSSKKL